MEDESDCTLFVGDLSKEVTEIDLYSVFRHVGDVAEVVVKCSKVTGQPMGYGFVRMATGDGAEQALTRLAGVHVKGRCIRVGRAERNCRLIVKNLDHTANIEDLIHIFMQYGPLHQNDTGHEVSVNGYSARIVHFINRQDAERAKRDLHMHMFSGRQMHVEWYRHTPNGDGGGEEACRPEPVVSIHVRFIAVEQEVRVDEHLLYHVFKRFGEVTKISIKAVGPDKGTNLCKGYAFVHFPSSTDGCSTALLAASATDDQVFSGVHFHSKPSQNFHRAHEMLTRQGEIGRRHMPRPNSHNGFGVNGLSASSFPRPNSYPADDRIFAHSDGLCAVMDEGDAQHRYPPYAAGRVRFDQRALAMRGGMARTHRIGSAPPVPPPAQPYKGRQYIPLSNHSPHSYGGVRQQPYSEPALSEFGEYVASSELYESSQSRTSDEYHSDPYERPCEFEPDSDYAISSVHSRRRSRQGCMREMERNYYADNSPHNTHDAQHRLGLVTAPRCGGFTGHSSAGSAMSFLSPRGSDSNAGAAHSAYPDASHTASPTSPTSNGSYSSWSLPLSQSTFHSNEGDVMEREVVSDARRTSRRWDGTIAEAGSDYGGNTSIESTGH